MAEQHADLMARDFDFDAFRQDHLALELLRPRAARLAHLMQRKDETELALGSDLRAASPEGHGVIKVSGKHKGVDDSRRAGGPLRLSPERARAQWHSWRQRLTSASRPQGPASRGRCMRAS